MELPAGQILRPDCLNWEQQQQEMVSGVLNGSPLHVHDLCKP